MRIAIVHSYYSSRQPSGENQVVDAQVELLRSAGHEVELIAQRTDVRELRRGYRLSAAVSAATGKGPSPIEKLERFNPHIVHVHNLFPNWGTSWLRDWEGPVVATLHNFRAMCAAGTLVRNGHECTLCPDGEPLSALRFGCYRGSRVASAPLAWANRHGLADDDVVKRADALVVMADRARDIFNKYGVPAHQLHVIPNFVTDPPQRKAEDDNGRWLFVGRLAPEKGLLELLSQWPGDEPLDVVGSGPLEGRTRERMPRNGQILGLMPNEELLRRLPRYRGLVLPSRWPESAVPLVVIEAMAAGVPVIALRGNAAADLIEQRGGGIVVADYGWQAANTSVAAERGNLSSQARAIYESEFQPSTWLDRITTLYRLVVDPQRR